MDNGKGSVLLGHNQFDPKASKLLAGGVINALIGNDAVDLFVATQAQVTLFAKFAAVGEDDALAS